MAWPAAGGWADTGLPGPTCPERGWAEQSPRTCEAGWGRHRLPPLVAWPQRGQSPARDGSADAGVRPSRPCAACVRASACVCGTSAPRGRRARPVSISRLACRSQDSAVVLALIETVDTVMAHVAAHLHTSEPRASITGSSSMAGRWQVGGVDRRGRQGRRGRRGAAPRGPCPPPRRCCHTHTNTRARTHARRLACSLAHQGHRHPISAVWCEDSEVGGACSAVVGSRDRVSI